MLRLAVLPAIAGVAILAAWKFGYFELERRQRLVEIVEQIRRWPGSEIVYVAAYALTISVCLPAAIGTFVGGAVFGTWKGAVLAWIGALVATIVAHFLARSLARAPVNRLFRHHRLLRELKEHDSVLTLLRLRLLPVAPFAVLDYIAGVSGVSLRRLVQATTIGVIPSVVAYAYAGSELLRGFLSSTGASHRAFWIAGTVTLVMITLSLLPAAVEWLRD
jgi:uncharacterized membrane protein YdjX (TVP38/TMEM64 family)